MSDPYKSGMAGAVKFVEKKVVKASTVVVLRGTIRNRGLQLINPRSRCVREKEIFEFMVAEDLDAAPGKTADNVRYLGFAEVFEGGSICVGDKVYLDGALLGIVSGFDETHMPNHQNMVLKDLENTADVEKNNKLGAILEFRQEDS